jgi:hypothetical protein
MKPKLLAAALGACLGTCSLAATAADHAESPTVTADPAADIADVFFFRPSQGENRIVAAISFAGRPAVAPAPDGSVRPRIDGPTLRCDPNVLYVINIDNNADGNLDSRPDVRVLARLARNGNGQCGVQVENIPGAAAVVSGRTDTVLTDSGSGLRVFAGLVEDPFFFDSIGFGETLATFGTPDTPTGELRITNTRDTFGGRNLSAIVFEMALAPAAGGDPTANPVLQMWGETLRFPGTQP